ncbi:hypothetical protein COCSADRAFT_38308 [Bipolaris sorokiniana ND90Pr]|uniref:Transmembrane protein n=1 Tax=Cochliobolus sativus (strain ND90Pr / ATCC 201652) TaxID=665912 RepID=M2S5B1_COCSN|nr:uncharacterized protein COCSADRAFT_38308 [Bipolaris sorokiniana ND90Pr]EMD62353.1 hypothetical protein COCSADRAFT_38308 [Bipolaris sorokiniana ND90Pr]
MNRISKAEGEASFRLFASPRRSCFFVVASISPTVLIFVFTSPNPFITTTFFLVFTNDTSIHFVPSSLRTASSFFFTEPLSRYTLTTILSPIQGGLH